MAPEYDKLFEMYQTKRDDVVIARIEGSINEEISFRYGISSFPVVVLFVPNDLQIKAIYQNQRVALLMSKWIEDNTPILKKDEKLLQILEDNSKNLDSIDLDETNLDDNLVVKKDGKSQLALDELELMRKEVDVLKIKILDLENEINSIKNNTVITHNSTLNTIPTDPYTFDKFVKNVRVHIFDYLFIIAMILLLIAAFLTCKKVFSINTKQDISHHEKV